jgi:hypothetical protein
MASKLLLSACSLLALGIVPACGVDSPSAPTPGAARSVAAMSDRSARNSTDTVVALARRAPLDRDVTAVATIGAAGGVIIIPEAGVAVVFPPGALTEKTSISMTAKAGWSVAYEFSPHGITFEAPVLVMQDLSYLQGRDRVGALQAGYYQQGLDASFVDAGKALARVTELRNVDIDRGNPNLAAFYIFHFSGYIMSSGRAGDGEGDGSLVQP